MYCVQCGVKLEEHTEKCPLCGTPLLYPFPKDGEKTLTYSERYPVGYEQEKKMALGLVTGLMALGALISFLVCIKTYGCVFWSGYVMLGLALVWIIFVFPGWFRRFLPEVFIPIDFLCTGGYLLYVCLVSGGHWFLSFAFPVTGLLLLISEAAIVAYRYIRKGRLRITGILLIVIGCSMMLIEFFQSITFGTEMFLWSLFGVAPFSAVGLFFIVASMIPALKASLQKRFFV